ncbi:hypothetical protein TorRG33x02_258920 [Trema orientale]|uniref:Secreted protein n=1 Tax=Trema orientale TaxID=63057 RepID=A0A2P5D8R8_TREOI|nr:hypothetical protein TorRG33x02_258920 [Trema orientale]
MNPALLLLLLLLPCLLIPTNSFAPFLLLLFLRLHHLGLNSLNLQPRIRQRLVNRQRKRLQQLQVERPHIPPLPRHDLHDPIDGRHHILHNLTRAHRRLGDPHHATSPRTQEQQRRATRPLDLLLPIPVPQIHGHRDLLLLEELLPQQPGQERHHALVGEEHVVGVAELALGLEGPVVGLELGEPEDLGDGDSLGTDLLHGVVFGEIRLGPVVDDEAELGGVGEEGVGERDLVGVDAVPGWDFLQGEHEVDELVFVQELGLLGLGLGIPPFEEGFHGLLHRLGAHSGRGCGLRHGHGASSRQR